MARRNDIYTSEGAPRKKKPSLKQDRETDLEMLKKAKKMDEGKTPVRVGNLIVMKRV
jgi:hypothetical protein